MTTSVHLLKAVDRSGKLLRRTYVIGPDNLMVRERRWGLRRGEALLEAIKQAPHSAAANDDTPIECLNETQEEERQQASEHAGPMARVFMNDLAFAKHLEGAMTAHESAAWFRSQPSDLPRGLRRWAEAPFNETLDSLEFCFPHFQEVLDLVRQRSALARLAGTGLALPPMLLLGEPGVGKTHFAKSLARALRVHIEFVDMSCSTASWILSGSTKGWEGSKTGRVHDVLVHHAWFNPVFVLDELDKASEGKRFSPLAPLYQLLERNSARAFRDEHIPVPLDASGIIWIGTANTPDLPLPLLSRMEVFTIPMPTEEQRRAIAHSVYQELQEGEAWGTYFPRRLDSNVVDFLAATEAPARDVRRALEAACARAAVRKGDGPLCVRLEDVKPGLHVPPNKRRMGFVG